MILSSRAAAIPCPLLSHFLLCVLAAGPGEVSIIFSGSSGKLVPWDRREAGTHQR